MINKKIAFLSFISLMSITSNVNGQSRFDNVTITSQAIAGSVHALFGAGGNIGLSSGPDGILIVDDQYAPLADKISNALGELGSDSPKYIINTHFHGDHTGTNAFFSGQKDATIFAHSNVRVRLASGEEVNPASLPVVTYETGLQFHFNNETIHVFHLPAAHTDGDSAVWFEQPDVLHTGDLFFNGLFPFIDLNSGGSVLGYIKAVKLLIDKIDEDTVIIPGHGPIAMKPDLINFVSMIEKTNEFVDKLKDEGLSEDQAVSKGLPEEWAPWSWSFINEERWIRTLYKS